MVTHMDLSADGKQALFEARGGHFFDIGKTGKEIHQPDKDLRNRREVSRPGCPTANSLVYASDESGEYELYHKQADADAVATRLTDRGGGYIYKPQVSPDGKQNWPSLITPCRFICTTW